MPVTQTPRPVWVCADCVKLPPDRLYTWHMDTCDLCGETKPVMAPRRDYEPREVGV